MSSAGPYCSSYDGATLCTSTLGDLGAAAAHIAIVWSMTQNNAALQIGEVGLKINSRQLRHELDDYGDRNI